MKKLIIKLSVVMTILMSSQVTLAQSEAQSVAQRLQQIEQIQRLQREGRLPQGARPTLPSQQANQAAKKVTVPTRDEEHPHAEKPMSQEELIDTLAFRKLLENQFPLAPEQIIQLRKNFNKTERAVTTSPDTPPKPTASSQIVHLAPGSTPPVIRLSQGFVSSMVFLDSTGAAWPIESYDLGNPQAFNIQWDKKSNTLMVQASKQYTYGNIAVKLRELNTPVMLTLVPGQEIVDYRVDLRIQHIGPNATHLPSGDGLPATANPELLSVLDGVPPQGAELFHVTGGEAQVWIRNGKMFVRTNLTILSPSWLATMSSADGTHAYEMQTTPLLLVSHHGKVRQLKIEGL